MTALRPIPSRLFARADDRRDVPVCRTTTTSSALLPSCRAPGSTGREHRAWRRVPSARTVSPPGPVVRCVDLSTPRRLRGARIRPVFVTFTHQPRQVSRSRTRGGLSTAHFILTHLPSVDDADLRRRVGVLRLFSESERTKSARELALAEQVTDFCLVHDAACTSLHVSNPYETSGPPLARLRGHIAFDWATHATSEPKLAFSRRRGDDADRPDRSIELRSSIRQSVPRTPSVALGRDRSLKTNDIEHRCFREPGCVGRADPPESIFLRGPTREGRVTQRKTRESVPLVRRSGVICNLASAGPAWRRMERIDRRYALVRGLTLSGTSRRGLPGDCVSRPQPIRPPELLLAIRAALMCQIGRAHV